MISTPQHFTLGISHAFLNKTLRPGYNENAWRDSYGYKPSTLAEIVEHTISGGSKTGARFQPGTRSNETFIDQQVLTFDCEAPEKGDVTIANALAVPLVRQFAYLIYHTGSSGKVVPDKNPHGYQRIRIEIALSVPIDRVEGTRSIYKAIARALQLPIDPNSFKPAQPAHGSTNHVEPPYINLNAVMPIEYAGALTVDEARADMERDLAPKPPRIKPTTAAHFTWVERKAAEWVDRALNELASAVPSTRHETVVRTSFRLAGLDKGGWPVGDWRGQLRQTALAVMGESRTREIDRAIRDADKARPYPLELPAEKPTRSGAPSTIVDTPAQTLRADVVQNQSHFELPIGAPVIAGQSDVGTGKTTALIQAVAQARSAIYLAHRERLAENFSRAAQKGGVAVEHYKELSKADRRRPARSAFCINSYSALANEAPGLPVPELLALDEIEQLLGFVYGDTSGIFNGREAVDAAEALQYVIRKAGRVLAMDAHLSDLALDYLKAQGRDVQTVVNQHVTPRGALTIHSKRDGAIARGRALVIANEGVVAFACASASRAGTIAAELVDLLGNAGDVLLLTRENGGGERQAAFFRDPNRQIGQYRAIVYSPVIGTGFDITAPVRAVVGIMAAHLDAFEARQMIGRCRNTQETHVYLPTTSGQLEESAAQIEADELAKAERTIKKLSAGGVRVTVEIDAEQRDYLRWHARIMARRNWSINHLRGHFLSLCRGYTISTSEHDDPELRAKMAAIEAALDAQRRELVLTVAPIDAETFRRLSEAGKADESVIVGRLRDKIEGTVGTAILPALRDALWTSGQRQALRSFTDLIDDIAELKLFDAHEQIDGVPLPRRRHRTIRRNVVNAFLRALITGDGERLRLSRDELENAAAPLKERYGGDLRRLFGWRPDRCKAAARIIQRVLDTVGLKLDSEQVTTGGEHVRYYQINQAGLDELHALAEQRLTMLRRKRAEERGDPVNLKTAIGDILKGNGTFEIAADAPHKPDNGAPGWAAAPYFAALTAPIGKGY